MTAHPTNTAVIAERAAHHAGVTELTPWIHPHAPDVDFYLGAHRPAWIQHSPVPLFTSVQRLNDYRDTSNETRVPKQRSAGAWDSGGFTELADHGEWRLDEDDFGGMVYRLLDHIGMPRWVAPQDWMCEPMVVMGGSFKQRRFAGTFAAKYGFAAGVRVHQELTVENLVYLRAEFPHAPWIAVLQGWTLADYLHCVDLYASAGVDLRDEAIVGLGSVCRRQATSEIAYIVETLASLGLRLHGFGVKTDGLALYGRHLASADSMAWSDTARHGRIRLDDCEHQGDCRNCLIWALVWREKVMARLRGSEDGPWQMTLDLGAVA